jgi:hypothetical protein
MALGVTIPIRKEALVELITGRWTLSFWVLVTEIAGEFILVWMSCVPTTRQWTWDATYYTWRKKK